MHVYEKWYDKVQECHVLFLRAHNIDRYATSVLSMKRTYDRGILGALYVTTLQGYIALKGNGAFFMKL